MSMSDWKDVLKETPKDGEIVLVNTKQHLQYKVCKYSGGKWFYRNPFNHAQFLKMSFEIKEWRYME